VEHILAFIIAMRVLQNITQKPCNYAQIHVNIYDFLHEIISLLRVAAYLSHSQCLSFAAVRGRLNKWT
jgi:hypothetical protein